jgi:hypothetical protein
VFDLLSEKGICHVQCNASLLISETAGKNCGKETGFRSLSVGNFSLCRENKFSCLSRGFVGRILSCGFPQLIHDDDYDDANDLITKKF